MVEEAAGFDDGEEVPAEFGLALGGEDEGDHGRSCGSTAPGRIVGFFQEGGDTGGVVDDPARIPVFGEGDELGVELRMLNASPELTVDDLVAGVAEGFEEGEVDVGGADTDYDTDYMENSSSKTR